MTQQRQQTEAVLGIETMTCVHHGHTCVAAGAGGNPVLRSGSGSGSDACRLWLQPPRRPTDSLTAQLAAQVEASKEQLQQCARAADAATLTAQCALSEATQQVSAGRQKLEQR